MNLKDLKTYPHFKRDREEFVKIFNTFKFCPVPFVSLYSNFSDGKLRPCCVSNTQKAMDKTLLKDDSTYYNDFVESVWLSDEWKEARESFLNGEFPKTGCETCIDRESRGMLSDRFTHLQRNNEWLIENFKNLSVEIGNPQGSPFDMDLRPSNLCNLTCRMCTTVNSSKLNDDVEKFPHLREWVGTSNYPTNKAEQTMETVKNLNLQKIKYLKLLGGEPLADPAIVQTLQHVVASGHAKNMTLNMTTNATLIHRYLKLLSNFKGLSLSISLEGTGKTFEYIREGAKWDKVLSNYEKLQQMDNVSHIGINLVFSMHNIFTVEEWLPWFINTWQTQFYEHKNKNSHIKIGPVNIMRMRNKPWLCPSILDKEDKDWFRNTVSKILNEHNVNPDDPKCEPWYKESSQNKQAYKKVIVPLDTLLDVKQGEGFYITSAARSYTEKKLGQVYDQHKWRTLAKENPLPPREELLDMFKRHTNDFDVVKKTNILELSPKYEKYVV